MKLMAYQYQIVFMSDFICRSFALRCISICTTINFSCSIMKSSANCFADFQFGPQSGWFVEHARKNINLDCFDLDRNRLVCGFRAAKLFVVFEFGPRSGSRMCGFGPRSCFSISCPSSSQRIEPHAWAFTASGFNGALSCACTTVTLC